MPTLRRLDLVYGDKLPIPTHKTARFSALIDAFYKIGLISGKFKPSDYIVFDTLCKLYAEGGVPEAMLTSPEFVNYYEEALEIYKEIIKL